MRGLGTIPAEVIGSIDQPYTELMLPDAINDHTGRQGIVWTGDPVCQGQPTLALGSVGGQHQGLEQRQCSWRHGFPFQKRIPAVQTMGRSGLRKSSGVNRRRLRKGLALLASQFQFRQPASPLRRLGFGEAFEAVHRPRGLGGFSGERHPIIGGRHGLPDSGFGRHFDAVLGGQAILEVPFPITPPDHATNALGFGEF